MLYLFPEGFKVKKAKSTFLLGMQDFVFKRIDKISRLENINVRTVEGYFSSHINGIVDDILIAPPHVLNQINASINPDILLFPDIRKAVEYVFNYDSFCEKTSYRYCAYTLAQSLGISTCTYCNRNYTSTVIRNEDGKKIARPQFDHYFDKASNPLLAISFFNLIPSCSVCNSTIKGTHKMNLDYYLHPYVDNSINDIKFTYKYSINTESGVRIKIETPADSKAEHSVDVFALEEVYNSHICELQDLLKIRSYFSDRYLQILESNLTSKGINISREDMYRMIFGVEYKTENFVNRPFSKFKNDILRELGVI